MFTILIIVMFHSCLYLSSYQLCSLNMYSLLYVSYIGKGFTKGKKKDGKSHNPVGALF